MPKNNKNQKKWNLMAIFAVATMWFPFAGLILGIVALIQIKQTKERGVWLAITAIVVPILATIATVTGVYLLISSSIKNTKEKADSYGITVTEYNKINSAIDGSCRLDSIQTGSVNDEYYAGAQSSTLYKVQDGFAVGYRQCYSSPVNELFLAKKDYPDVESSAWRVIYSGATLPCSLAKTYDAPQVLFVDCANDTRLPVRAL